LSDVFGKGVAMIFGNQTTNQDDAAQSSDAAGGSFLVGGAPADPSVSGAPLPSDMDDDTAASAGTLDQPAAVSTDDGQTVVAPDSTALSDESGSAEPAQEESFSGVIAPADRDIPAVVHASVKSSLINPDHTDQSYDDDTSSAPATPSTAQAVPDDLLDLKQQALSDLSPLVDHLDQTPEEKFRTTMMMIQSTDNSGLIKDAYAAAQAITDDKVRAQALLDVVNEINYFTQQAAEQPEQ
jgi:hypothetical protein